MLTKKNLRAISKLLDKKFEALHNDIMVVGESIRAMHKDLFTKQDLKEYTGELRNDIKELNKLLHMYMELTKVYREKQTILEEQIDDLLIDLGYSEN